MNEIILPAIAVLLCCFAWVIHIYFEDLYALWRDKIYIVYMNDTDKARYFIVSIVLAGVSGALSWWAFKNSIAGIMVFVTILMYRKRSLINKKNKYQAEIDLQAETALELINALYESTNNLEMSIKGAAECIGDPLASELRSVVIETEVGIPIIDALKQMAYRLENREIEVFVKGVAVSEKYGTDTAQVINDVGQTINDRITVREELKNETRGKTAMIGLFLTLIPLLTLILMVFMPSSKEIITETVIGKVIIIVLILVEYGAWHYTTSTDFSKEI